MFMYLLLYEFGGNCRMCHSHPHKRPHYNNIRIVQFKLALLSSMRKVEQLYFKWLVLFQTLCRFYHIDCSVYLFG